MFKEGVDLKKNAWYIRLMHFMWGAKWSDFPNLCPLFWAVIGSILIFPLWCIWRALVWICGGNGKLVWENVKAIPGWIGIGGLTFVMCTVSTVFCTALLNHILVKPFDGGSWEDIRFATVFFICGLIVVLFLIVLVSGIAFYGAWAHDVATSGSLTEDEKSFGWFVESKIFTLPYNCVVWVFKVIKILFKPIVSILYGLWLFYKLIWDFFYQTVYKKNCPFINWED